MKELIQKLVTAFGPTGFEDEVRSIIQAELGGLADEVNVGKLGSLIALKKGAGQGKKIMLVAHMDEIGLMVTHIDNRGFARVMPLGTVFPLYAVGQRVRFADGRAGVLCVDRREDSTKVPNFDQLYIDLGAKDKQSCPVQVGDVAAFQQTSAELDGRLMAKSLDDRLGCAMLIEMLRRLTLKGARAESSPHDVYCVFSVQEETTSAGARTAAYSIQPDVAIVVDVTSTGDTPKALPMAVELGKGPAIKVRDAGSIADPRVRRWMVQRAKEAKIPYQLEILRDGSTDADVIQPARDGVPSGGLLVPCRHLHSPSELVDMTDVEQGVKLLVELVKKPINLDE